MNLQYLNLVMNEHPNWELQNFGPQHAIKPMLGMQEEIGELTHAVLKQSQGIRSSDAEEVKDKIRDAIGDILVYLVSYAHKTSMPLIGILESQDILAEMHVVYSLPSSHTLLMDKLELPMWAGFCLQTTWSGVKGEEVSAIQCGIAGLYSVLGMIASIFTQDTPMACLERAWEEVKKRDWKFNPWNGQEALPIQA